jgi:hypothetical protein
MSSKRTSLASLVVSPTEAAVTPEPTPPAALPEPAAAPVAITGGAGEDQTDSRPAARPRRKTSSKAKYAQLTPKMARIREEQYDRLTELARALERRRPTSVGERITENTLIRVAIDLLLTRSQALHGINEAELLNTVLQLDNS